jgi:hypothetical protein
LKWAGEWHEVVALLRLRVTRQYALCNILAQSQPVMWGDVDEVNAIAYLRMLGSDHSIAANHIIFYGQAHTELRSFLHGKEALHVATAETYLLCHGAHRCTSCTCQFDEHLNVDAGITPAFRSLARVSISQSRPESILPTGRGEHNHLDLEGEKRRKYASKSPIARCGISTLEFQTDVAMVGAGRGTMYCNADPEATPTIADQGVDAEAAPAVDSGVRVHRPIVLLPTNSNSGNVSFV